MVNTKIIKRYSLAFKQKVVSEIETGQLSIGEVRKLYDITGNGTVEKWIRNFGKNHLLSKVVRIEMTDEVSRLKQLEKDKQALESALAQTQLKLLAMESLIEVAEQEYGIDIKKNCGAKGLKPCEKK